MSLAYFVEGAGHTVRPRFSMEKAPPKCGAVIDDYMGFMRDAAGAVDAAIVRQVLGENRSYADVELPRRFPNSIG
jgi:hypothetical protein